MVFFQKNSLVLATCPWELGWPWLCVFFIAASPIRRFFFFFFFFPLSMGVICASQHAFALVACPRGLLRLCCLPMDAALTLVTCFSNCGLAHGCWEHARGQRAHGDFLSLGCLPNGGLFYQMRGFSKRMFFSQWRIIWASQHAFALALAVCPQGLPWPLLLSYNGFLGFDCVT